MPSKITPEKNLPQDPERHGPLKKVKAGEQPHHEADPGRITRAKPARVTDAPLPRPRGGT